MNMGRVATIAILAASLAACGGDDSSPTRPPVTPPVSGDSCSLSARQDWALGVLQEWYLFPNLLDTSVNKANYSDLQSYLDALVAPARADRKDRGFTYITSIAEENDLIQNGSNAGFGIRLLYDTTNNRVFVAEAFENAPAFQVGFDRGTELLEINGMSVASLMASGGPAAVSDALGPTTPGVTRTLVFRPVGGSTTTATIAKQEFALDPISDRYGVKILSDGAGGRVGYINLRTFIVATADRQLADAFQLFANEGLTSFVIDLRYNGGGLVRIAELLGDLMRDGNTGKVFSRLVLRDSKSSENETRLFQNTARFFNPATNALGSEEAIPAVNPVKLAFITTGNSASASELIINSMLPYVQPQNIALIGDDTFGKPVGQFAFDRAACDDRLRVLAFKTVNANGQGDYFNGLADFVPNTCRASDDIFNQLGDPREASVSTALDFIGGRGCTSFAAGMKEGKSASEVRRLDAVQPARPNTAQRDIPGLF